MHLASTMEQPARSQHVTRLAACLDRGHTCFSGPVAGIAAFSEVSGGKACVAAQQFQAKRCSGVEFGMSCVRAVTSVALHPASRVLRCCSALAASLQAWRGCWIEDMPATNRCTVQAGDRWCGHLCAGLYSAEKPQISGSSGLSFKTWTGAYPKLAQHFAAANLDPSSNQWNQVLRKVELWPLRCLHPRSIQPPYEHSHFLTRWPAGGAKPSNTGWDQSRLTANHAGLQVTDTDAAEGSDPTFQLLDASDYWEVSCAGAAIAWRSANACQRHSANLSCASLMAHLSIPWPAHRAMLVDAGADRGARVPREPGAGAGWCCVLLHSRRQPNGVFDSHFTLRTAGILSS